IVTAKLKGLSATGEPCREANNKLDPNTHKFLSDCGPIDFCNGTTQTCELKGCRVDEFPFGYDSDDTLPEMCADGYVCPDEESSCQPLMALGGPCQLNRDDECALNPVSLSNASNMVVCLHYTCQAANISLGQTCLIDNTVYSGFLPDGSLSSDVVMRDNCDIALYCDSERLICQQTAAIGQTCQADSHCNSSNCKGTCAPSPATPLQLSNWVYVFVVVGILLVIFGIVFGLLQIHKVESKSRMEMLNKYWDEQLAFRESIINL
ncbi:uncharacterized protein MELLADRAFT_26925, partial [Melampsora larici-populina 98AG31]